MAERMDIDPPQNSVYPLLENSSRIAAFCFTTDDDSNYGQADFDLLKPMWERFGCRIKYCKNPTINEFWQFIFNLKHEINTNAESHDYLALTMIGHGGQIEQVINGKTFTHEYFKLKNGSIRINEVLWKFSTTACYGLAGCPVIVFVQACRGHEDEIPSELAAGAADPVSQLQDYYVLNACAVGTKSYYDLLSGESYFCRSIKTVFETDYEHHDLVQMGKNIRKAVLPEGYCQSIEATDRLKKDFRFNAETVPRKPEYRGIVTRPTNPVPFVRSATSGYASDDVQVLAPGQVFSAGLPEQALSAKTHGQDLYNAAKKGDEPTVRTLLNDHNIDVNYQNPNEYNYTPLIAACFYGHQDVVTSLLNCKEIDLDITDEFGQTALMKACWRGHTTMVAELLRKGAAYDLVDNSGETALMWACGEGHTAIVTELLSKGAAVNLWTNSGKTALMRACSEGHTTMVAELLSNGAAVDLVNKWGDTALSLADNDDIKQLLEENGAAK